MECINGWTWDEGKVIYKLEASEESKLQIQLRNCGSTKVTTYYEQCTDNYTYGEVGDTDIYTYQDTDCTYWSETTTTYTECPPATNDPYDDSGGVNPGGNPNGETEVLAALSAHGFGNDQESVIATSFGGVPWNVYIKCSDIAFSPSSSSTGNKRISHIDVLFVAVTFGCFIPESGTFFLDMSLKTESRIPDYLLSGGDMLQIKLELQSI